MMCVLHKIKRKVLFPLLFPFCLPSGLPAQVQGLPVLRVTVPGNKIEDNYQQGSMILEDLDGTLTELPAKFKTRGATAKQYTMKPSFNMKLREDDGTEIDSTLLGLRSCSSWILDAMAIDRINMRNRVCFDIWNAFSRLPYDTGFASRNGTIGRFVEVFINGDYKGIYCLSDRINRKLLDLKKPQVMPDDEVIVRGVLYKHGTTDWGDQNTPGFFVDSTVCVVRYHDAWELKEPEDYPGQAAWQPLLDYYDEYERSSGNLDNRFFEDNLVDYTLLVMALSISDNWGNKNKYFSVRNIQETGSDKARIVVSPWDLDTSLGGSYNGTKYNPEEGGQPYSSWAVKSVISNPSAPFTYFLKKETFKNKLRERWLEVRDRAFAVDSVAQRLYSYGDLFLSTGAWQRQYEYFDSQKSRPCYVYDLEKEIELIVAWYRDRHQEMDSYFGIEAGIDPVGVLPSDILDSDAPIYNLQGMPVSKKALVPHTIYISKGRKWMYR